RSVIHDDSHQKPFTGKAASLRGSLLMCDNDPHTDLRKFTRGSHRADASDRTSSETAFHRADPGRVQRTAACRADRRRASAHVTTPLPERLVTASEWRPTRVVR